MNFSFQRLRFVLLLGLVPLASAACATVLQGTRDQVGIASQPTGAEVIIDNEFFGKTPVTAELRRKDKHNITIKVDGYEPYEITVTRKTSGFVFGNVVFGPFGLIGLAVDAITGGMYKLKPEQVQAELHPGAPKAAFSDGTLYVILTPKPDPAWEKVGQLQRSLPVD
jgi:hypothetical protein